MIMDRHGLATIDEVREYLRRVGKDGLLKCVRANKGRYELVADQYDTIKLPSVRYQVACILMVLGEYAIAEDIHRPRWSNLSTFGDKVGNSLLKHFMKAYPR